MITITFLFLLLVAGIKSCPNGQLPCGSTSCYDPTIQGCKDIGSSVQCINSCNGTCYSSSQYCYNNTKVCNIGESVCDVRYSNLNIGINGTGPTCYDPSQMSCLNHTLCSLSYSCGTQCIIDWKSTCANNQTICPGYDNWNRNVNVCGSQQQCYDNTTSVCLNNSKISCVNSCNTTCYSNSQYCYNNTKVCNIGESVCDVRYGNPWFAFPVTGLTCYNSSQLNCLNHTLCYSSYSFFSCGTQCITDSNSTCSNSQTICPGYSYLNRNVNVCGSQGQCYDSTTSVCLNNNRTSCINSCNGICYSSSQYCYNNTKVCNIGESVCDVQYENPWFGHSIIGLTCYDPSQFSCLSHKLCYQYYVCGTQCIIDSKSTCASNQTICPGYYSWNRNINVCGSQQQCYDNTTSICVNSTNTVYCLNNSTAPDCKPSTSTTIRTVTSTSKATTAATTKISTTTLATVSSTCCTNKNCTKNSDRCRSLSQECQCYRHNQTDTYGSCVNPNVTPICSSSCPVQGICKSDSDCCKCQCATIAFTDSDGQLITKKQCAQR